MHKTPPSLLADLKKLEELKKPEREAAWNRLVELYAPFLRRMALRRCPRSEADALDLVQAVFLKLVEQPHFS
jgi:DNA-directed RNA polymerase specialized sigma24 family protein